ncbi:MAG: multidrug efflux SMR transporter [Telmatospirillum sp.]|nr:multidrug efflux SMR transporter [Telmatospirillum sp.]
MAWIALLLAGLLETVWALLMKKSAGLTLPLPTFLALIAMAASVWLLSQAMRSLPLGTAYSVWTGIGAAGAFVTGILLLGEAASPPRFLAAAMILAGVVILAVTEPG